MDGIEQSGKEVEIEGRVVRRRHLKIKVG
ncbi:uncharacterized protein G2W53_023470 [Senna tora]|uniref:Uncharacterized protein n=1 Tax=Senna tora TaxID=362788 RepID=A0A834WC90_9FABA|nr:uncharacterized protein G2W53_023470 [Senna tora]